MIIIIMTLFKEEAQLDMSNLPCQRSSIKNNIYKHLHINIQTYLNTNKQKSSMPKVIYLLSSPDIQT